MALEGYDLVMLGILAGAALLGYFKGMVWQLAWIAGIGADYLSVSTQAHEELLGYLAAHRDIYWTDTFINIMQYVKAQRALKAGAPSAPQ